MSEHEQRAGEEEQSDRDQEIEDLDVPEQQAEDVGGGNRQVYQWWKKVEP